METACCLEQNVIQPPMDRLQLLEYLTLAEKNMQESAARIESQLDLIAEAKRHQRDTTHAMKILEEFCKSYAMRAGIVERLRSELALQG